MRIFLQKINKKLFSTLLFAAFYFINQSITFADDTPIYEAKKNDFTIGSVYKSPPRTIVSYTGNNAMCNMKKLDFSPFGNSDDIRWELDNPTCIAYVASVGVGLFILNQASSYACEQHAIAVEEAAQIAAGVPMSPAMIKNTAKKAPFCTPCFGGDLKACLCCGSIATAAAGVASALVALGIIYGVADGAQKDGRICGHDWNIWELQTYGKWLNGKYKGSYQKKLEDKAKDNALLTGVNNKEYREYIYGGIEHEDNGEDACTNPWGENEEELKKLRIKNEELKELRIEILGYSSDNQRYYMRGPKVSSNFACYRFLYNYCNKTDSKPTCDAKKASAKKAFDCCNQRSQETICIESSDSSNDPSKDKGTGNYKFCKMGSKCNIKGVTYEAYESKVVSNFICAKTYSVCPYNHLLGSGSEIANYCNDPNAVPSDNGKCKCRKDHPNCDTGSGSVIQNNCQYLKHCARVPDKTYIRMNDLEGAIISGACFDMRGDSQNNYKYNNGLLPLNNNRYFSAPMAQCFKETMENMFLHRAGHSVCKDHDEIPSNDKCISGYAYQKGDQAPGISIFENIQTNLRDAIKLGLTVAIMILGINILMGGKLMERKEVSMFVIKLGLVSYFALGNAWQTVFFDGVFNAGSAISNIVMQPDHNRPIFKLDGCQFPRYNYNDDNDKTKYDKPSYPPGKEYLAIWDLLDCKIARAIGFGPEVSVPNIIIMMIAGFFTGGLGIIFVIASFMCAFFLLALTIRALHIFLMSSIAIILMIYVSPITITLSLFKRTSGIFTKWYKNLISFALQPIVLFAYLGILVSVFDNVIIGSATFEGTGINAEKTIKCNEIANDDSLYCIFKIAEIKNLAEIKNFSGLEAIGIGIPVLVGITSEKLTTVAKAAFVLFIFTQFLEKITYLAATLTGGAELKGVGISATEMATKSFGASLAIQKRGMGLSRKIVSGVSKKATSFVRSIVNTGKSTKTLDKTNNNKGDPAKKE